MSDRTREIIRQLALEAIRRAKGAYGDDREDADEMALNFFCGAAAVAGCIGDEELASHLTSAILLAISVRGMSFVHDLAEPKKAGAA